MSVRNIPVETKLTNVSRSVTQFLRSVSAAEAAPVSIEESFGDFEDYTWIEVACFIITAGASPSYIIRPYYYDTAVHLYTAGDLMPSMVQNRLYLFKSYGRKMAVRVESLVNITVLKLTVSGWQGSAEEET